MYFLTYLRRELRRRMRQSVLIALGLALGVGLVVTVASVSAGVRNAQSSVLGSLYGVGTDLTVTGAAPAAPSSGGGAAKGGVEMMMGPSGPEVCTNGKCSSAAGQTIDTMRSPYASIAASKLTQVAGLHDVASAAGELSLTDTTVTFPAGSGDSGAPESDSLSIDGVDTAHLTPGPLSSATLATGASFTAAEQNTADALVDSAYATAHNLKAGSTLTIDDVAFTVIGTVNQAQAGSPPQVYIPLAKAQAYTTARTGALTGDVNTIYITAASAADITTVQSEVTSLLPGTTVTTAASLADEVTGSLASTATLANDLGTWLSILVLIAAFTVACLLTMSAVARRASEFGTLKAIGWRSRRIIAQVLGESAAVGVIGAAAGIGLGYAGAALISHLAPPLSATVGGDSSAQTSTSGAVSAGGGGGGAVRIGGGDPSHTVSVLLTPQVTVGAIVLAVILAVAGGLLAGAFGSWRIAGLRPVDALARVA